MAPAALHFASRTPKRVVFRVARVAKTLGVCMSADDDWIAAEVVVFELSGGYGSSRRQNGCDGQSTAVDFEQPRQ
jgi:hypothetical protein